MLTYLAIENFALIERLELEFEAGLSLVTGETGSGKSILVDALGQLLGRRASREQVRTGAERARITGRFRPPQDSPVEIALSRLGIDFDAGELIIRREITQRGANRIFINGVLSSQGFLSEVGSSLADIHGQHDQQSLLQTGSHLLFLDRFAVLSRDAEELAETFRKLAATRNQLKKLDSEERERLQRIDTLRFQISEINQLKLVPGVIDDLGRQRKLLGSAEKRLHTASSAYQVLYESELSLLGQLEQVRSGLADLVALDARLAGAEEKTRNLQYQLEEIAFELRDYVDGIEFDLERLEVVESRLAEISRARKKYGETVTAILRQRDDAENELLELENSSASQTRLREEIDDLEARYRRQAETISQARHEKARSLKRAVEKELAQLAMTTAQFEVSFQALERPSDQGLEEVEFLFSANPGEPPKPLTKVASGGELSRIILSLKSILLLERYPKTLVFDEVDSGIGGRVAGILGSKLSALAQYDQVFCVTHLPQVAARADHHFVIDKIQRGGRTLVTVRSLEDAERVEELARMLTGDQVTPTTLEQARELISRAHHHQ